MNTNGKKTRNINKDNINQKEEKQKYDSRKVERTSWVIEQLSTITSQVNGVYVGWHLSLGGSAHPRRHQDD